MNMLPLLPRLFCRSFFVVLSLPTSEARQALNSCASLHKRQVLLFRSFVDVDFHSFGIQVSTKLHSSLGADGIEVMYPRYVWT